MRFAPAMAFARAFDASVTALHVIEPRVNNDGGAAIDPLDWEMRRAEAEAYLDRISEQIDDAGIHEVKTTGR